MVKIAAIQHDIVWEDAPATCEHVAPMIAAAATSGAALVLLPEMFATGFSMDADAIAQPPDGSIAAFLVDQARQWNVWVGGSIAQRASGERRARNVFVLASPTGDVVPYAKVHPFTYAGEHERYAPGEALVVVDVHGLRCALFVCYDLRFGDEFWSLAPDVDAYFVVANWPASRREHWRTLLRARAIENQAYVVGVNRVGEGGGLAYSGDSAVIGPFGEELADAGDDEAVLLVDVDPAQVAETRAKYPFLRDRGAAPRPVTFPGRA